MGVEISSYLKDSTKKFCFGLDAIIKDVLKVYGGLSHTVSHLSLNLPDSVIYLELT